MPLTFRSRYWSDPQARRAFMRFIHAIHNVDFAEWEAAGYWDDDYIPFSFFEGERVAANVCIYTMPAIVNGERCRVAQVSGVGTAPEHRRRGLARRLHAIALEWALQEHRFAFLFADRDAMPFYAKVGFEPVADHAPCVRLPGTAPRTGLQRLDLRQPAGRAAVYALACERAPVSHVFASFNPRLVMYHALYGLREHAYRIEELDAIVFSRREGARVVVYDVLARELPRFADLYPWLTTGGPETFEFRFPVDRLQPGAVELRALPDSNAHTMRARGIDRWVFPFTAHA